MHFLSFNNSICKYAIMMHIRASSLDLHQVRLLNLEWPGGRKNRKRRGSFPCSVMNRIICFGGKLHLKLFLFLALLIVVYFANRT